MIDVSEPVNRFHVSATHDGWTLAGDIDASTASELAEAFAGELPESGEVVVDLADVTFIDSSGLRVFVDLNARLGSEMVTLRSAPRNVRRLLDLTALSSSFRFVDTADD